MRLLSFHQTKRVLFASVPWKKKSFQFCSMIYHEFAFSYFFHVIVAHPLPPRRWPPMCCEPKTETDFSFFLVYICMQMCESIFLRVFILVLTGSYLFAECIYRTSILQTPTEPSQCRAHSIQITLHFGHAHAVSCTQNNVFIKWIAMPNYCTAAASATMSDRTSREKNGLCKLCARRSCVAKLLSSIERQKKK